MSWTIQQTSQRLSIYSSALYLRLASSAAYSLFAFFVGVGSNAHASKPVYYRYLNKAVNGSSATLRVNRVYYFANDPHTDLVLWPFLAGMDSHYQSASGTTWYFPKGYSFYGTNGNYPPYTLSPSGQVTGQTVPDDWGPEALNYLNQGMSQLTDAEMGAINGFVGETQVDSDGNVNYIASFTYHPLGTVRNGGVVTLNDKGVPEIRFPESDGYIHGYRSVGPNQYEPTYYRIEGNQSVELSEIQSVNSSALTYDSDTGLYELSVPDYSTQLASIARDVEAIRNNPWMVDVTPQVNVTVEPPEVTVEPPEVNVSPEVTVNPTVTVTPDVTVNVTAPTQNDITVAIDNSDLIQSIDDWQNVEYSIFGTTSTVDDFDTTSISLTQDEQGFVDIVQGWQTNIPVISNACNIALGAAFGNIPTIPASDADSFPLTDIRVLGFNVVIDWTPYASHFRWFRAFCLMLEVVWFINSLYKIAIKTMQV